MTKLITSLGEGPGRRGQGLHLPGALHVSPQKENSASSIVTATGGSEGHRRRCADDARCACSPWGRLWTQQLLLSGPGPGQDGTAWPGEATTCHATGSAGEADTALPSRCEVAVAAMRTQPGRLTEDRTPPEAKDEDDDKDSLYPGQLEAPRDVAYTPGEERPTLGRSVEPQDPGSRVLESPPPSGCVPETFQSRHKSPHKSSNTHTILTEPPHAERATRACPQGLPTKGPEVQGERCIWSATEKTTAWPPPPLISVCPGHAGG